MKEKKFISVALIYVLGSFLIQGVNFMTIPIFTRLLSPEDFGIWGGYSSGVAIVGIFIGLKVYSSINNAKIDFKQEQLNDYVWSILKITWSTFLISILAILIFGNGISRIIKIPKYILILGLVEAFFMNIFITVQTKYIAMNKTKKYLLGGIINSILTVSISIIIIPSFVEDRFIGRILGGVIAISIMGAVSFIDVIKGKPKYNKKFLRYGMALSLPLIFQALSNIVLGKADQMMLLLLSNSYEAGIYNFSSNIGHVISVLYLGFNQAFVPWYFLRLKNGEHNQIMITYREYVKIFTTIFIGFLCLLPECIKIMGNKEFENALLIVPIIAIGYYFCFMYSFPVNFEFYNKCTGYISVGSIGAAVVNILLNILLIPIWGSFGAALTTMISYIVLFLFHFIISKKVIKNYHFEFKNFIYPIVIVVISVVGYYLLLDSMVVRWGIAFFLGLTIIINIINFKKEIIC